MLRLLFIGIGGFFGAVLRSIVDSLFSTTQTFPYSTLCINVTGCFLLAWLLTRITNRNPQIQMFSLLIGTGLLGAFTTFSTFSYEIVRLIHNEQFISAILYISISVIGGILFGLVGVILGRKRA